jgi:uncharacterized membrane protein (UPF0127 family)
MPRREWVDVRDRRTGLVLVERARWGASFMRRLRGLMFRRPLQAGEALILVEARDSRVSTTIHMFGVSYPIAAVWIDDAGRIVDKALALPWRPYYAPREPARYILEARPEFLERVSIGDEVAFEDSTGAASGPRRAAPGAA